jgi:hypothetical protein
MGIVGGGAAGVSRDKSYFACWEFEWKRPDLAVQFAGLQNGMLLIMC